MKIEIEFDTTILGGIDVLVQAGWELRVLWLAPDGAYRPLPSALRARLTLPDWEQLTAEARLAMGERPETQDFPQSSRFAAALSQCDRLWPGVAVHFGLRSG